MEILPGVWVFPHVMPGFAQKGAAQRMLLERGGELVPDDFSHEVALVFDVPDSLRCVAFPSAQLALACAVFRIFSEYVLH